MPRGLTTRSHDLGSSRPLVPMSSRVAVVVDLADARDGVAAPLEHLRQRHDIGNDIAEIGHEVFDTRRIRAQPGQQRHAARAAQWKLRVGPIEPHAPPRQAIEVRRLDETMTVDGHVVVQVVRHDQEDVRLAAGLLRRGRRHRSGQNRGGDRQHRYAHGVFSWRRRRYHAREAARPVFFSVRRSQRFRVRVMR